MLQGTHSSRNSSPNSGTSHHQDTVGVIRGISSQENKRFSSLSFNIYPILSRLPVNNFFFYFIPIRNGIESTNPFHTHHHSVIKDMYGTTEQTTGQAGNGSGCLPQSPKMEPDCQSGRAQTLSEIRLLLDASSWALKNGRFPSSLQILACLLSTLSHKTLAHLFLLIAKHIYYKYHTKPTYLWLLSKLFL